MPCGLPRQKVEKSGAFPAIIRLLPSLEESHMRLRRLVPGVGGWRSPANPGKGSGTAWNLGRFPISLCSGTASTRKARIVSISISIPLPPRRRKNCQCSFLSRAAHLWAGIPAVRNMMGRAFVNGGLSLSPLTIGPDRSGCCPIGKWNPKTPMVLLGIFTTSIRFMP